MLLSFLVVSLFHSVWASGIRTGGRTPSAPTGCSPRDRGRLLAVNWGLSSSFFSFYSLQSTPAGRPSRIRTGGGTPSAPTGCSPRDRGRLLAVDCGLSSFSLLFFTPCTRLRRAGRVGSEPVEARQVHPLGVVPETMVDRGQSTVVLVLIVFVVFRCKITSPL